MSNAPSSIILSVESGLSHISREDWNGVANPVGEPYDPFLDWDFLEALEATGCAGAATGWSPQHLVARDDAGGLVGAMPLYLKSHSRGEFVFDHAWADAYMRAGGRYYPKLLCGVPFTPVTGRRMLAAPGPQSDAIKDALVATAVKLADENGISSLHINFVDALDWESLAAMGFLKRQDQQFHWLNEGYESFDDFLAALSSSKRKNLRKERAKAQDGVAFEQLTGDALTEAHWDVFFKFYQDTGDRKWGSPYLNRDFFSLFHERMADKILLVLARDAEDRRPIAGALNLIGSDALFGRYWGRTEERPCLHFETCYYQAIDYAAAHGLARVEAGAQGEHKLARGYVPTPTYSAHWIADPGFADAVENYLEMERREVDAHIDYLGQKTPFRRGE